VCNSVCRPLWVLGTGVLGGMGRKHRETRKAVKARLRLMGWRENEFGELVKRGSKAAARQALLTQKILFAMAELDIFEAACKRAREDICAIEDAAVFAQINEVTHMESAYVP
jgi:hypothetical protein